jgi:hypothetical protein
MQFPCFRRRGYKPNECHHENGTIIISLSRATCSLCNQVIEAIVALNILARAEYWRARKENADAYHRLHAEELAEKQAAKTRKAAYATLYRFGVTPEMYDEEYRRQTQFTELESKQDYSKTLDFSTKEGSTQ